MQTDARNSENGDALQEILVRLAENGKGPDSDQDIEDVTAFSSLISGSLKTCRVATAALVCKSNYLAPFSLELELAINATLADDQKAVRRLTAERDVLLSRRNEMDAYAMETAKQADDAAKQWDKVRRGVRG